MAPRADVSGERKTEIVNAAARVFSRKGFSGARMDDIVTESGLSKGLLYWYFKSKDAIIAAIMERMFKPEVDRIRQLISARGSAGERLMAFADFTIEEIEAMGRFLPITFEYYSLAFRNRTVRKAFREFFDVFLGGVAEVISQGVKAGEFNDIDPRAAAMTIGAALEGSMLLWLFDRKVLRLGAQIRTAIRLVVRGMERSSEERK
jgi:AcrR family transcriptional regulator